MRVYFACISRECTCHILIWMLRENGEKKGDSKRSEMPQKQATAAERHKIKTKNENTTAGKEANGTNGLVEHNTQHMHMNLLAIRRW